MSQIINFDDFAEDKVTIGGTNYKPRKTKVLPSSEETSKKKKGGFKPKEVKKNFRSDENDTDTDIVSVKDLEQKYQKEIGKIGIKDKLSSDAKNVLAYQLKKLPQYKVIEQQITLLTEELKAYKKTGDENKINECKRLIEDLAKNKVRLTNVFKNKRSSSKTPEEIKKAFSESEKLTELLVKKKETEALIKSTSASYYITKLKELKEQVQLSNDINDIDDYDDSTILNLDDDDFEIEDIDINSLENESVLQKYHNYCGVIGDLLGLTAKEVTETKVYVLKNMLSEKFGDQYKRNKENLNKINAEISMTKSEIKGDLEITNVMFEVFDFKNEETIIDPVIKLQNDRIKAEVGNLQIIKSDLEQKYDDADVLNINREDLRSEINHINAEITFKLSKIQDEVIESADVKAAKEILAAANVGLVSAIAYKQCEKIKQIHNLPDAISYGLLGLSQAINKWFQMQKLMDSALSFQGFLNISVSETIKKGLYEITCGGQISGTSVATLIHFQQKRINAFIENNPEFEGMDKSLINDIIGGDDNPVFNTVAATDYTAMVGGEDGSDSADIFANTAIDAGGAMDSSYEDAREQYAHLVKGIKTLFSMFRTQKDSEGNFFKSSKKLFDKYDRKLFILYFGLGYDKDLLEITDKNKVKRSYTNIEIAEKLTKFAQEECGEPNKTFTASALFAKKDGRLTLLLERLKIVMEQNSEIKMAFEYLLNFRKFEAIDETWNEDFAMDEVLNYDYYNNQQLFTSQASSQDMFSQYIQDDYYR